MKNYWVLIGLSVTLVATGAEEKKKIYKYTDENGVTHYTENKPNDDYQEADLPQLSVVPSAPVKSTPRTEQGGSNQTSTKSKKVADKPLKILAPVDQENLWGTGGKLTAKVPALSKSQQDKYAYQFVIDGKKQKPSGKSTQVFSDIYRGEHKVKVNLINKFSKEVIKSSPTITVYVHQNSKK